MANSASLRAPLNLINNPMQTKSGLHTTQKNKHYSRNSEIEQSIEKYEEYMESTFQNIKALQEFFNKQWINAQQRKSDSHNTFCPTQKSQKRLRTEATPNTHSHVENPSPLDIVSKMSQEELAKLLNNGVD